MMSEKTPPRGRHVLVDLSGYVSPGEDEGEWMLQQIRDAVAGKKGIVAFDKIFGYSGTGHVDIFNGEQLSDATNWYPARALKIWFV